MPVLVEAISLLVPISILDAKYPGGSSAYAAESPAATFCTDGRLTRVGFMSPLDVEHWVSKLESHGLRFVEQDAAVDFAVADQVTGWTAKCEWAMLFRTTPGIVAAALVETPVGSLGSVAFPAGWRYERSISCQFEWVPNENVDTVKEWLGFENGCDVYRDRLTGKISYIGRTKRP